MNKLPSCDRDLWKHGTHIMTIADLPSKEIENWVVKIREESGQHVDWHYVGGRACVRFLGDEKKVRATIQKHLSEIISQTDYWRIFEENYQGSVLPLQLLMGNE